MEEKLKEIGFTLEGETKIKTKGGVEITIPSHLPLINPRLSGEQLERVVSFCRNNKRRYLSNTSRYHINTTEAIKEEASNIYQSFLLIPDKDENKISAFSEVQLLKGAKVDCIIVGPSGAILVEVKPFGSVAKKQLEKYNRYWRRKFPTVPLLTLKASYRGNKVSLT